MRPTIKIAIACGLATAASTGVYGLALADDIVPTPTPPSYDLVTEFGTKSECVPFVTVMHQMLLDQGKVGGKTLALTKGMEQAFADQWRAMAHMPAVKVKLVLAHGYATGPAPSDVVIDTVEFDDHGCAISRTLLKSAAWDAILHGVAGDKVTGVSDPI